MKKKYILAISFLILCLLSACQSQKSNETTPTGYASNEIDQPQIMYNDTIFYYWATGFNEDLPDNYRYIGKVESVNNKEQPSKNYGGSRLEAGQNIYASDENPGVIYIEYENGYARFSPSYIE